MKHRLPYLLIPLALLVAAPAFAAPEGTEPLSCADRSTVASAVRTTEDVQTFVQCAYEFVQEVGFLKGLHTIFPAYKTSHRQFEGTVVIEGVNDAPISVGAFEIGPEDGEFSGIPEVSDWKSDWKRIAETFGTDTTLGQMLQFFGISN